MADLFGSAVTAEIALSAATAKTILQLIAPTNHRVKILGWGVSFDGTSASAEPVVVRLLRQTTAGTVTSLTPKQTRTAAETIQSTASHTATAEPTAGDVLDIQNVHPQGSHFWPMTPGQEIVVGGGGRIGIECTAPANVNVIGKMFFEE